ncbi:MAG: mannose-6-phosphate isomerase, class I [Lewinellaceae bacterium]|nr:mannose-6-phosphate isomerase, class I [Phaeodactylibacter sp.]MCB0613430.1 mannose-6-phosphate isomerase, class I [Phaeodactylibacter sp.]MCB9346216.1 mannose-6-phosphate isomerase, class I [Lewinellaceae bacterium]
MIKVKQPQIFPLQGAIQHYAWGGFTYLPELLGIDNQEQQPFAELWMGAHDRGPGMIQTNGQFEPLPKLLEEHPNWLGKAVQQNFGGKLPYLFKVLDVRQMLSIQSHPTKTQAEAGFRRENEQGIPLDAPNRNFKDDNHKPEVMAALTEFWLLHGFKNQEALERCLRAVPEFSSLLPHFANRNIFQLYKAVMEMPQAEVDRILQPMEQRLRPLAESGKLDKRQPEYWAMQAFDHHRLDGGHYDRGVFSIFFFNLVKVMPGEGIYQGAGIPHAYLEGVNVELMANSDNVFRGGLTVKHVDVPELLEHLVFEPVEPQLLKGDPVSETEWAYRTPAPDFQLNRIQLSEGQHYQAPATEGAEIVLIIEGEVSLESGGRTYSRGDAFFVPAGSEYVLRSKGKSLLFKALTP